MMAEDNWMGLQPSCGKRPRSPVDKLADLAAAVDEEEGDWRSSKRYLTEVIANGFSKLSVKLGSPPQQQQQPQQPVMGLDSVAQQQQRRQPSISPKAAVGGYFPGTQLPAAAPPQQPQPLQLQHDMPMDDIQTSPQTWPPQLQQQPHRNAFGAAAAAAAAPGSLAFGGAFAGGLYPCGLQVGPYTQQEIQPCAAGQQRSTPSPEGSPQQPRPCAAYAAPTGQQASLIAAGAAAGAALCAPAGLEHGPSACSRPALPPLQTSKGIRAAEKPPQSPSDLSSSSLRKVALLRSLLARAEQQFQQQQQQPTQGKGQPRPQQQPSRMQPPPPQQQQQQPEGIAAARHSAWQQQEQQPAAAEGNTRCFWAPPWPTAAAPSAVGPQALQQQQQPALPPRPVTPWELSSDDMDCSSAASSLLDSDGSSSQPGLQEAAAELPVVGSEQDQAMSALLCREVLCGAELDQQQRHEQLGQPAGFDCRAQQAMPLPFSNQATMEPAACAAAGTSLAQQQQQQQAGCVRAARQGSPELSRQKLEELRAKALASTKQLTCLTQEDLTSLQLGIAVPRRTSCDSSTCHTPSGLQQQDSAHQAALPAVLRRHSSHI